MIPKTPLRRGLRAGVALVAAALFGACGGGVETDVFVPQRLIVFGDEASTLEDPAATGNGRKYMVNTLKADKLTLDCAAGPLWVQSLAGSYGLTLPQCNPDAVAAPPSRMYAAAGARVAGVKAQIDSHGDANFTATDLVTVLVGTHDIVDEYGKYPAVPAEQLVANVEAAGRALGLQVNRIADAGAKVLVATAPDLGLSPFAKAQDTAAGDTSRSALLSTLSARFNAKLRTTLPADGGRSIGLVLFNELVASVVKNPQGFFNVTDPACDVAKAPLVQNCTTETLVLVNAGDVFVWSDDRWPSPGIQKQLGALAIAQSRRNPF